MVKPDFRAAARANGSGGAKRGRGPKAFQLDPGISALEAQTQELLKSTMMKSGHKKVGTKKVNRNTKKKDSHVNSKRGEGIKEKNVKSDIERNFESNDVVSPKVEPSPPRKVGGDFSRLVTSQTAQDISDIADDFWKVDIEVDPGLIDPRLRQSQRFPAEYGAKRRKKKSPKATRSKGNAHTRSAEQNPLAMRKPKESIENISIQSPKVESVDDTVYDGSEDPKTQTDSHLRQQKASKLRQAALDEASIRRLSFTDEVQRVSEGLDEFVPDVNVSHRQVLKQEKLLASKRQQQEHKKVEHQIFQQRLLERERLRVESEAAVRVQCAVRGRNSRKFVQEVKRHGGYADYLAAQRSRVVARSEDPFGGWQEVYDPTTGDLWYFNSATGESQWELPLEMGEQARDRPLSSALPSPGLLNPSHAHRLERLPSLQDSAEPTPGRRSSDPGHLGAPPQDVLGRRGSAEAVSRGEPSLPRLARKSQCAEDRSRLAMAKEEQELLETELPFVTEVQAEPKQAQRRSVSFAEATGVAPPPSSQGAAKGRPRGDALAVETGGHWDAPAASFSPKKRSKKSPKKLEDESANLRDTVRSALLQSKYDSVSTLLAKQVEVGAPVEMGEEEQEDVDLSEFGQRKPRKVNAKTKRDKTKQRAREKKPKFQPPTMFDVGYAGMPTDVSKSNTTATFHVGGDENGFAQFTETKEAVEGEGESGDAVGYGDTLDELQVQTDDFEAEVKQQDVETITQGATTQRSPRKKHRKKNGIFSDKTQQNESKVAQLAQSSEMNQVFAPKRNKDGTNTCFLCWSMGDDRVKSCDDHGPSELQQQQSSANKSESTNNSILLCMNWSLETLRKKYRSEEIQEIFAKSNSSLKWDLNRKKFVTVVQASHPTYRDLYDWVGSINKNVRAKIRLRKWFKSISDKIHAGKIAGEKAQKRCGILRVRSTLANNRWIRHFDQTVYLLRPKAPKTPDDIMLGKLGDRAAFNVESGYLVMHRAQVGPSLVPRLIVAPRTVPELLYQPETYSYDKDSDQFGRVLAPSYHFSQETPLGDESDQSTSRWGVAYNVHVDVDSPIAWFERMASHVARTAISKTVKEVRDQVPELTKLRTKNTAPTTVKYARFSRRMPLAEFDAEEGGSDLKGSNRWVKTISATGGIPGMAILSQAVTTQVPAQYGKIVVTSRQSLKPPKQSYDKFAGEDNYLDQQATFRSLQPGEVFPEPSDKQVYSALDARQPPTITCSAFVYQLFNGFESADGTDEEEAYRYYEDEEAVRNYHGANRENQTGEAQYTGFRTTALAEALPCDPDYDLVDFVPSTDIAVPNDPCIHGTKTTRAGPDYPFCVPTTRDVSLLDHFHILASGDWSSNSSCCFTALGKQDPGEFSIRNKTEEVQLGPLEMRIYRSFAYFQMPQIEAYFTVEGVPYWFNKKTGETFWESPLVDMDAIEDEDELPMVKDELQNAANLANDRAGTGGRTKEISQLKMRQHMLTNYDEVTNNKKEKEESGSEALFAREIAKSELKKKAQEMKLQDRVGKVNVLKADPVTLGMEAKVIDDVEALPGSSPGPELKPLALTEMKGDTTGAGNNAKKDAVDQASAKETTSEGKSSETKTSHPPNQEDLVNSITTALAAALQQQQNSNVSADDMLKLGLGLGLGLGMQQKQEGKKDDSQGKEEKKESTELVTKEESPSSSAVTPGKRDTQPDSSTSEARLALAKKQSEAKKQPSRTPDEEDHAFADQEFETHSAAGEGHRWEVTEAGGPEDTLVRTKSPLPNGFINSVYRPHTAKQHTDYLPTVPNLNEARSVGVVKPRQILEDWEDTKFDPWSDGKSDFATSFIPNLHIDEATGQDDTLGEFDDSEGNAELRKELERENKLREELEHVFSCARHGKYSEIEEFFDDPDCTLPIDSKDSGGNTLLSIAAQNGNKRIAKLCLRRGADVNTQNINGQSLLHYCFAYGFEDLAQYFMDKGADDSLVNADGLTCYEGLNLDDVQNL